MADDVRSGKRRTDDIGRLGAYPATRLHPEDNATGVTPEEVNQGRDESGPRVEQNDDLKRVERQPRLGNEEDKPDSDALGG